ncbi:bifunctional 4-hydroxy-2-oxoglutarate aldolase/2-dehydro-3-deoxy-phosphogluconate aldolase [Rhodocytophaga aerolata]|uniref:Bifunctional 4-hydroxy-2-oxoglutarate aldolase/2-dehydro-3-deoxy-phosphogluconate aldolase n=1 Tax=Rhodocytophaga aerolata TaxID=455078 RepID=A0ABT8R6T4_9BACT|nr:bifunctional 4-hydroxy-2-oxoglutarate aldolase/2-dehydro-3-deoxy-phosphogluconate aldolase [Rhodocytophaga aerolata]MDO1447664.1 bifunctional 4-hydroxy-2-oxoglutarate aldolase/2-dehydro-3-deoxy-phosphogluconate aldolase [Rhodocytophaga aerolata]
MFSWELFYKLPIIGILRGVAPSALYNMIPLYIDAGFTNLEITMNSQGAVETIKNLRSTYEGKLNIGAGTVCTQQDLQTALEAGATYIVTPVVSEKIIALCVQQQIPIFPGAYTPTEIYTAWQAGASMVKVFPATTLGAAYIKEVKAPLNEVKLLPTGGVSAENLADFFKAGAEGVGMGSQLFPAKLLPEENRHELRKHFTNVYQAYEQYKRSSAK